MSEAQDISLSGWQTAWIASVQSGDALLFATGVMGFLMPGVPNPNKDPQLEPWQVKALKKFSNAWRNRMTKHGRLSIRSGHGVGKTCFLCIIILFVMFAGGPDTKIPVVANTLDQLRDGLWPEAQKWINRLPPELKEQIHWQAEKIVMKCAPEECFAVRKTASKARPEALQGIHARNILAILEEASGIPEETIEAGLGTLSTEGAMAVAVGNPTRASGFFYKIHCDPRVMTGWDRMVVSSEDVPRARGHIDDVIRMYGKNSNRYAVRVLGEFPKQDDDVVIPKDWAEAAKGRPVTRSHVWPVWGVDVGRLGPDRSTLLRRQGNTLIHRPNVWRDCTGPQLAGKIIHEYEITPNEMKPREICVDVIGVGTSVYDHLTLEGSPVKNIVTAVNVSESPSINDNCLRLRDDLWWRGRQWFEDKTCCIPDDLWSVEKGASQESADLIEQLIAELTSVTYDFSQGGKIVVESKKDIKKDGGHSPDLADGFLNSFAAGVYPREVMNRRIWEDDDNNDPWGA